MILKKQDSVFLKKQKKGKRESRKIMRETVWKIYAQATKALRVARLSAA